MPDWHRWKLEKLCQNFLLHRWFVVFVVFVVVILLLRVRIIKRVGITIRFCSCFRLPTIFTNSDFRIKIIIVPRASSRRLNTIYSLSSLRETTPMIHQKTRGTVRALYHHHGFSTLGLSPMRVLTEKTRDGGKENALVVVVLFFARYPLSPCQCASRRA